MEWYVVIGAIIGTFAAVILLARRIDKLENKTPQPAPQVTVNLQPLQDQMAELPTKVLQSITSSANTHKGALGELIGYINLRASYDRIVPLGNIVDFMCIKFPTSDKPGHVDFIDIKTGNRSRLSKDQRELQKLIEEKKINFVKLKVDTTQSENTP